MTESVSISSNMFPARAGMSRLRSRTVKEPSDVPRASGDEPEPLAIEPDGGECSPRERG